MKTLFHIKSKTSFLSFFKLLVFKLFVKINNETESQIKVLHNKDYISQTISIFGTFEEETLKLIVNFLKKNFKIRDKNIIDGGSNIGNHSIVFSQYFKKIYSYEPHPINYLINKINTKSFKNIEVFNYALGDKKKKSVLFEDPKGMGGHSFLKTSISNKLKKKHTVKMITLDSLKHRLKNIFLIKLDVENYEFQVLKGGLSFISKYRPIIIYECKIGNENINKLLIKNNYKIFYIKFPNDFKNFFIKRLNNFKELFTGRRIEIIHDDNKIPKMNHGNLIAIPEEKTNRLNN
tara:strand:- start:552 stop:1424 length:873 start_codon:yes stop_codon:yes gene_type:complete